MRALMDLVLIDLYDCEPENLLDEKKIKGWMKKAAELMGAEAVASSFYTFKPHGISGTVTIAESHLAVHTWPEHNFAALTFETCGHNMDHLKAYYYLVKMFKSGRPKIIRQQRSFIEEDEVIQPIRQGGENLCP